MKKWMVKAIGIMSVFVTILGAVMVYKRKFNTRELSKSHIDEDNNETSVGMTIEGDSRFDKITETHDIAGKIIKDAVSEIKETSENADLELKEINELLNGLSE